MSMGMGMGMGIGIGIGIGSLAAGGGRYFIIVILVVQISTYLRSCSSRADKIMWGKKEREREGGILMDDQYAGVRN